MTDNVTLHLGDCLEVMAGIPDGSVDAVVTDPPYCSGGFSETGKRQAKGQGLRSETVRNIGWFVNDNMTTGGLVWLLRSMAMQAARVMKQGGSLCLFTDWRMLPHLAPAMESAGIRYQNMLIWDKGSMGLGCGFRPQHEVILHYVKGTGTFYDQCTGNVVRCKRVHSSKKQHQTEKPIELIEIISKVVSPPQATILDPFMGSGTTGVACVNMGRKFIGIEKDPGYFKIAQDRIAAAQAARAERLIA